MHAISTLLAVSELAGRLEPAGDQLRALLPRDCPDEIRARIRQHKPDLLALLRLEFIAVESAILNEIIFFAADEQTKGELVKAGAEACCVYTRDELHELQAQHRCAQITADELLRFHTAKRLFDGRVADQLKTDE